MTLPRSDGGIKMNRNCFFAIAPSARMTTEYYGTFSIVTPRAPRTQPYRIAPRAANADVHSTIVRRRFFVSFARTERPGNNVRHVRRPTNVDRSIERLSVDNFGKYYPVYAGVSSFIRFPVFGRIIIITVMISSKRKRAYTAK